MKNILLRGISGTLYVALIVASLLMGPVYFCTLCVVFGVLGIIEFRKLAGRGTDMNTATLVADLFCVICLTMLPLFQMSPLWNMATLAMVGFMIFVFYMLVRFIIGLYVNAPTSFHDTANSIMGVTYLSCGIMAAELMANYSTHIVLLLFIFIWINDTGAFLVGSAIGKHRLFERLSPKKSWEGFFGGLLFVCLVSLILGYTGLTRRMLGEFTYFGIGPYVIVYILPIVAVVFATWGDLFESLIKRSVGAKDSGHLIPGHGGLLDRIDSMLFVMPASAMTIIILILLNAC